MLFAVEGPGFCLSALLSLAEPRGSLTSEDALRLPGSQLREQGADAEAARTLAGTVPVHRSRHP